MGRLPFCLLEWGITGKWLSPIANDYAPLVLWGDCHFVCWNGVLPANGLTPIANDYAPLVL